MTQDPVARLEHLIEAQECYDTNGLRDIAWRSLPALLRVAKAARDWEAAEAEYAAASKKFWGWVVPPKPDVDHCLTCGQRVYAARLALVKTLDALKEAP